MNISPTVIRAFAQAYTREQLVTMRAEALQELVQNPSVITSASTGGGASYSQQLQMSAAERAELYQLAIDYLDQTSAQADIAQFARPLIFLCRR
jgi:hypothetical protein